MVFGTYVKKKRKEKSKDPLKLAHCLGPIVRSERTSVSLTGALALASAALVPQATMAQANPQLAGMQQPMTYQDLYSGMPNTLNIEYAAYLTPFGSEPGDQPATLRDRVIAAANDVPKVFAMMQTEPTPRIVFVHRSTRYAPSLLGTQPWDNWIFGFQGDLHPGNQINLVEWPANPYTRTAPSTVPTLATMDAAWTNAGGTDTIGPLALNDPDTEQLRAQFLCPIPHCYVPLCLSRSYTPQSFWTDIIGQITQNQQLQDCMVLVNWARVASTYGPAGANGQATLPLGAVGNLRVPLADGPLSARRWTWVLEDLPSLGRTGTTLEQQFLQQNATLGNLLQRQVNDAAATSQADRADKEFSQVYPQAAVEIKML
jgi:hypothetical protein